MMIAHLALLRPVWIAWCCVSRGHPENLASVSQLMLL